MNWLDNMGNKLWDGLGELTLGVLKEGLNLIITPIKQGMGNLISTINVYSPEIITLAIVFCAFGIMIGPIFGKTNKWFGRTFLILWGGIIWRILI